MESTKFSNFSIDHILGSLGPSASPEPIHTVGYNIPEGYFHGLLPRGLNYLDYSNVGRVSVPRPPGSWAYHGMDFGFGHDSYSTYGLSHTGFSLYPHSVHSTVHRPAGFQMDTGRQQLAYLDNYQLQASERPQPCPTSGRMRTVFTDSQTKHLDKLFEITDYPGVETRAELARNAGLTEETVRVWFKNRRARRKKKHCSRVDTSPHSCPPAASKTTGLH